MRSTPGIVLTFLSAECTDNSWWIMNYPEVLMVIYFNIHEAIRSMLRAILKIRAQSGNSLFIPYSNILTGQPSSYSNANLL